jgi:uncharacterized protein YheU (UPF0270 family)
VAAVGVFVDALFIHHVAGRTLRAKHGAASRPRIGSLAARLKAEGVGVIKALFVDGRPGLDERTFDVDGYLVECAKGPASRRQCHGLGLGGGQGFRTAVIRWCSPAACRRTMWPMPSVPACRRRLMSAPVWRRPRAKGPGQGGPADRGRSGRSADRYTEGRSGRCLVRKDIDRMPDREEMLVIPHQQLSPEALSGLIEEFVTRDGTDSGYTRGSLAENVAMVRRQLDAGQAVIVYDNRAQTCNIRRWQNPDQNEMFHALKW